MWLHLELKCNIAASVCVCVGVPEQTGEIVGTCSSVPALQPVRALLCLPLLVAEREKNLTPPPKKHEISCF